MNAGDGTPQRVVLHVGLYKTGTSYLQHLMRQNRRRLARTRGVYVPPGPRKTVFASFDLVPHPSGARFRDARVAGAWSRLVDEVNGCGLPCAVVSEERLSGASARQARRAVSSFAGSDVHVVVTVRDLARVVVSYWQEQVKNGATWTLAEYVALLRGPKAAATQPARSFWMTETAPDILRTWASAVSPERLHVVTVPPSGAEPDLLVERFGSAVGFTAADMPKRDVANNENIGDVGVELVRRLNERIDRSADTIAYAYGVKRHLPRQLASRPDRCTPRLSAEDRDWADSVSAAYADEIRKAGYPVIGSIDDLQPTRTVPAGTGRQPAGGSAAADVAEGANEQALLDAALDCLAELAGRYGSVMAQADRERAASRPETANRLRQVRARLRANAWAGAEAGADVVSRTSVGRRLVSAYLHRRGGR